MQFTPDIRRLRWDDWNVPHIARHQVTSQEAEEVCHDRPMFSETYKERLRVVGPTSADRMLTVIIEPEGEGVYYVVTARPASRRERRRYQDVLGDETL